MKKRGFTLIELLGAIVILGILLLIAFPPVLDQIQKSKNKLSDAMKIIVTSAGDSYVKENANDFPMKEGNQYCITLDTLVKNGKLTSPVTDPGTGKEITLDQFVVVTVAAQKYETSVSSTCTEKR